MIQQIQIKDNNNRIIYKCIYKWKNEKLRIETNQKHFCNATIECKINQVNQNKQQKKLFILQKKNI